MLKNGPTKIHQYIVQFLKRHNSFFTSLGHFLSMLCREHRPIYLLEGKDSSLYDSLDLDRPGRQFTRWVKRRLVSTSFGKVSKHQVACLSSSFSIITRIHYRIHNEIHCAQIIERKLRICFHPIVD